MAEAAGDFMEEDMAEEVLDQAPEDTESEHSDSEADSPAGDSALSGKGVPKASSKKSFKKAKILTKMKAAAIHYWEKVLHKKSRAELNAWFLKEFKIVLKSNTFTSWMKPKVKAKILGASASQDGLSRARAGVADTLGIALREWFLGLPTNAPVNDDGIMMKAKLIVDAMPDGPVKSALLDPKKFNFSHGWVQNWKKQHGLKSYKKIDGEKGSADFNGATFGRSACHMILYNVQRRRIYNMVNPYS